MPAFDPTTWTERLARCVEDELWTWHRRMAFDRLRGLAIDCVPWHPNPLTLSFLTEREDSDYTGSEKWDLAGWRLYAFATGPTTHWPHAEPLAREVQAFWSGADDDADREMRRDLLCRACAGALQPPGVQAKLRHRYTLAPDFEVYAGHPDKPERNFCDEV